jgi:hypothetical protein
MVMPFEFASNIKSLNEKGGRGGPPPRVLSAVKRQILPP